MRKFDIILCSVLKMKGYRNAPVSFVMSVCLVPVNVATVECSCVCVCVCVCVCWVGECTMCACICEYCLKMLSVAKVIHWQ